MRRRVFAIGVVVCVSPGGGTECCFALSSPASAEPKNFDEESIASVSTSAQNETRDGFCPDDLPETSALQVLQERTYGFSFWPKVSETQLLKADRRPSLR